MQVWIRDQGRLVMIDYLALTAPPIVPTMAAQNPQQRTLNELFAPFSSTLLSCIVLPENNADQFEIGPPPSTCYQNFMDRSVSNPISI